MQGYSVYIVAPSICGLFFMDKLKCSVDIFRFLFFRKSFF